MSERPLEDQEIIDVPAKGGDGHALHAGTGNANSRNRAVATRR
jgi:hypothetical protein